MTVYYWLCMSKESFKSYCAWNVSTLYSSLYLPISVAVHIFLSLWKGGRFCHSAASRIWPLESCPYAALYSVRRRPGGMFCSLLPVTAWGRWDTPVLRHLSSLRLYTNVQEFRVGKMFLFFIQPEISLKLVFSKGPCTLSLTSSMHFSRVGGFVFIILSYQIFATGAKTQIIEPDTNLYMTVESFGGSV